jgi:hypothetical protein
MRPELDPSQAHTNSIKAYYVVRMSLSRPEVRSWTKSQTTVRNVVQLKKELTKEEATACKGQPAGLGLGLVRVDEDLC